jgi:hypothetical protein
MQLSPTDRKFIAKRSRLVRRWPWAGALLLVLLAALGLWLWFEVPFMVNPWAVSAGLEAGSLPESTRVLMAAILPVVVLLLLAFAVAVVLLTFVAFANERRLLRLLERAAGPGSGD